VAAGLGHASGNTRLVVTSPAMTNAGAPSSHLTMSNSPPNRRAAQPVGWVERRVESGWGIYISTSFCSKDKNAKCSLDGSDHLKAPRPDWRHVPPQLERPGLSDILASQIGKLKRRRSWKRQAGRSISR